MSREGGSNGGERGLFSSLLGLTPFGGLKNRISNDAINALDTQVHPEHVELKHGNKKDYKAFIDDLYDLGNITISNLADEFRTYGPGWIDEQGRTILHRLFAYGNENAPSGGKYFKVLESLTDKSILFSVPDKSGSYPLDIGMGCDNSKLVEAYLKCKGIVHTDQELEFALLKYLAGSTRCKEWDLYETSQRFSFNDAQFVEWILLKTKCNLNVGIPTRISDDQYKTDSNGNIEKSNINIIDVIYKQLTNLYFREAHESTRIQIVAYKFFVYYIKHALVGRFIYDNLEEYGYEKKGVLMKTQKGNFVTKEGEKYYSQKDILIDFHDIIDENQQDGNENNYKINSIDDLIDNFSLIVAKLVETDGGLFLISKFFTKEPNPSTLLRLLLLKYTPDTDIGKSIISVQQNNDINYQDEKGNGLLHYLCRESGNGLIIDMILALDIVSLDIYNNNGETPLMLLFKNGSPLDIRKFIFKDDLEGIEKFFMNVEEVVTENGMLVLKTIPQIEQLDGSFLKEKDENGNDKNDDGKPIKITNFVPRPGIDINQKNQNTGKGIIHDCFGYEIKDGDDGGKYLDLNTDFNTLLKLNEIGADLYLPDGEENTIVDSIFNFLLTINFDVDSGLSQLNFIDMFFFDLLGMYFQHQPEQIFNQEQKKQILATIQKSKEVGHFRGGVEYGFYNIMHFFAMVPNSTPELFIRIILLKYNIHAFNLDETAGKEKGFQGSAIGLAINNKNTDFLKIVNSIGVVKFEAEDNLENEKGLVGINDKKLKEKGEIAKILEQLDQTINDEIKILDADLEILKNAKQLLINKNLSENNIDDSILLAIRNDLCLSSMSKNFLRNVGYKIISSQINQDLLDEIFTEENIDLENPKIMNGIYSTTYFELRKINSNYYEKKGAEFIEFIKILVESGILNDVNIKYLYTFIGTKYKSICKRVPGIETENPENLLLGPISQSQKQTKEGIQLILAAKKLQLLNRIYEIIRPFISKINDSEFGQSRVMLNDQSVKKIPQS